MRFRELVEDIALPPRSFHYFKMMDQRLKRDRKDFERAEPLLKKIDDDRYMAQKVNNRLAEVEGFSDNFIDSVLYLLRTVTYQYFGQTFDLEPILRFPKDADSFIRHARDGSKRVIKDLTKDNYRDDDAPGFAQWIVTGSFSANDVRRILEDTSDEDKISPLDPSWYDEADQIPLVRDFLDGLTIFLPAVRDFYQQALDFQHRIEAYFAHRYSMHKDNWRPEHGEVETLYHATAYAAEIIQQGFAAEKPIERHGVGNFGTQKEISFTYDLKIATDIARSLKELVMIANGQLTTAHLLSWIKNEGLYDPKQIYYHVSSTDFAHFTVEQTAKLWRWYVAMSKIHPDPVFVSVGDTVKMLKGRDPRDVGVLAGEVALSPEHDYRQGEREFRVPASAVRSIRRIM